MVPAGGFCPKAQRHFDLFGRHRGYDGGPDEGQASAAEKPGTCHHRLLQLMTTGSRIDNRVQEISQITRGLKGDSKGLNVPVICLSQLSRSVEQRQGHRPMLSGPSRVRFLSSRMPDIVLFFCSVRNITRRKRTTPIKTLATCIVAKNRHGSTGDVTIGWQAEYTRVQQCGAVS